MSRFRPVRVEFCPAEGVSLLSERGHCLLGHLEAITGSCSLEWFVSAPAGVGELCELRVYGGTGGNTRHVVRTR